MSGNRSGHYIGEVDRCQFSHLSSKSRGGFVLVGIETRFERAKIGNYLIYEAFLSCSRQSATEQLAVRSQISCKMIDSQAMSRGSSALNHGTKFACKYMNARTIGLTSLGKRFHKEALAPSSNSITGGDLIMGRVLSAVLALAVATVFATSAFVHAQETAPAPAAPAPATPAAPAMTAPAEPEKSPEGEKEKKGKKGKKGGKGKKKGKKNG